MSVPFREDAPSGVEVRCVECRSPSGLVLVGGEFRCRDEDHADWSFGFSEEDLRAWAEWAAQEMITDEAPVWTITISPVYPAACE